MPSRLKIIELHGFKTFATRTDFVFSDTITAIVGPNGSGKSNIADAIRWVLGEQSYSLLRAKRTEDMIFSGSEHRSRSGMASVNIVFDNSEGWLPIDFTEVAITRRAYRDGQNEYLINGQRVRLKDVSELLSQSGLSERTYTVIGQGLVDAALALKVEERRRLFEEAAGIGLHRSRREEALRRLDSTRRNLERTQDILAELTPRLRSLERQSRRVQEFEQVKADLHLLLRDWYGFHWHHSQKELAETQAITKIQETSLQKARLKQDESIRLMNNLVHQIQKQRDQLGEWHNALSTLHTRREKINRDLVIFDERLRSLAEQRTNVTLEITRVEEEINYQQLLLKNAEEVMFRLLEENEEAQTKMAETAQALQKGIDARKQAEQIIQKIQQAVGTLTAQQSHLRARISERKSFIERQQLQLSESETQVELAKKGRDEIASKITSAENELAETKAELGQVGKDLQRLAQSALVIETSRQERNDARTKVLTTLSQLRAQLDVLEQAERSFTGYADGAKYILQAASDQRLHGIQGALSSKIEVAPEYETAVAAALGEFLDVILVDRRDQLDTMLGMMQEAKARSAFLPVDDVQLAEVRALLDSEHRPGWIGLAQKLVSVPENLKPVVDLLLNDAIVVESRADANHWIQYLRHAGLSHYRVVTLLGDVYYPGGMVVSGQESEVGAISRLRRRNEIQNQLEATSETLGHLEKEISDLTEKLKSIRTQESAIQEAYKKLSALVEEKTGVSNQQNLEFEKAQRNIQFLQDQAARLNREIAQAVPEIEKLNADLVLIENKLVESRVLLRERNTELAMLSTDELQTQLAHWQTRFAVSKQSSDDAHKRAEDLRAVIQRAERSLQILHKRLDEFQEQSNELAFQKKQSHEEEYLLEQEIQAYLKKIKPVETELASQEQEYAQLQRNEAETRQVLTLAEHQFAQARITLARRQESLESLRQKIEDDFGLVAFRYDENISGPTPLPLAGFVEQLPEIAEIPADLDENVKRHRAQLRRIGPVNPEIHAEYVQVKDRFEFLTEQVADLRKAETDLKEVIAELDLLMEREFQRTFEAVAHEFHQIFARLFGGGSARLVLTMPEDLTETGIDIEARLPGRREQGLTLLSGGERSLTAAALVFSLLKVSPTPFCVLDEVDAMLDEANVGRYRDLLRELSEQTQFVVITHNRNTVQAAEVLYGVTMGADSTSQVISLRLDEVSELV